METRMESPFADMHAAEVWKFCPLEQACQYGEFDALSKK
jgi:hypothetical protein